MGLGFVLVVWVIVGSALAFVVGRILRSVVAKLTPKGPGQQRLMHWVKIFPFACLAWAGAVFVFQAAINDGVFHRDPGLGDSYQCPLPNGYALLMIDAAETGSVYNPKTEGRLGGGPDRQDSISNVKTLQVAGSYLFGVYDAHFSDSQSDVGGTSASSADDRYFLLNTVRGTRAEFGSLAQLQGAAHKIGYDLKLEPISAIYARYRWTWFDGIALMLLIVPPLVAAWSFLRWGWTLRKQRILAANAS